MIPLRSDSERGLTLADSCGAKTVKVTFTPQIVVSPNETSSLTLKLLDIAEVTRRFTPFVSTSAECGSTILFAKHRPAIAGLFSGPQIGKSAASDFLDIFPERNASSLQICQPVEPELTLGIVSASFDLLGAAQIAIRNLNDGLCLNDTISTLDMSVDIFVSTMDQGFNASIYSNITPFSPKPQPDGTCYTYHINAHDDSWGIANQHFLQTEDIDKFNQDTWSWASCDHLKIGQLIFELRTTSHTRAGPRDSDLNLCPLNACCDVWGYCGTTADFCTESPADTNAPGTAKPDTNGCISNCGLNTFNNDHPPDSFKAIGYFEGFDQDRLCLRMDASEILTNKYTHIHFAFGVITPEFEVDISDHEDQFNKLIRMSGFRKTLSFGGWSFSTDPSTFQRFRDIPNAPPGSPDEGKDYRDFLSLLRSRLPSEKSISIALPASYWYLKQYPVTDIAHYVDYFIYMTYDFHLQWDVGNKNVMPGCEGGNCLRPHINKTETHDTLAMITKAGVEARQLMIGINSYG
ncbi:hypothetical protein PENSTE_c025G06168 [Penicillium steckii]|uniref:chitinase n=1 Tax=Penicillium steckii TaxID=303698 RepID=A0A1V6SRB4_9EURO|nr:hypothetical protein PENSTE_c025G06168 [Penicillium steckii]